MISKTYSAQLIGLTAHIVTIEIDLSIGLHAFAVVGLGDKAVDEAKDRISAAIKNSGYTSPKQKNQKVVISLAPADLRKEGTAFDLGMALGYLAASGEIDFDPDKKLFLGELSLEGEVRRVSGVLPLVRGARERGFKEIFVPRENAREAGLVKGIKVFANRIARSGDRTSHRAKGWGSAAAPETQIVPSKGKRLIQTFSLIKGQETAKRGFEIAAAGGSQHRNVRTARNREDYARQSIQHDSSPAYVRRNSRSDRAFIHLRRYFPNLLSWSRPFDRPITPLHMRRSSAADPFRVQEKLHLRIEEYFFSMSFLSLKKASIDALRQPMEDSTITISRARGTLTFPAHCIFIAAMNPCPCGYGRRTGGEVGEGKEHVRAQTATFHGIRKKFLVLLSIASTSGSQFPKSNTKNFLISQRRKIEPERVQA
jgi:magnesium chelatase family protein